MTDAMLKIVRDGLRNSITVAHDMSRMWAAYLDIDNQMYSVPVENEASCLVFIDLQRTLSNIKRVVTRRITDDTKELVAAIGA